MSKIVKHHTIPVAYAIEWYLENLWDGAWKVIKDMTVEKHRSRHNRIDKIRLRKPGKLYGEE
jgi:hypothetical protein